MSPLMGMGPSQADTRRSAVLTDQWGREWAAVICTKSGDPIGPILPHGWDAPYRPEQAFMRIDPTDNRKLIIDLDAALEQALEAHDDYTALWSKTAAARNLDPNDDRNAPLLEQVIGPKPKAWQPIKAALDGNQWILGFSEKVDTRLVPYLQTRQQRSKAKRLELESFMDEEEQHDPEFVGGGKTVPLTPRNKGGRPKKQRDPLAA